jgi:hypothetical protein
VCMESMETYSMHWQLQRDDAATVRRRTEVLEEIGSSCHTLDLRQEGVLVSHNRGLRYGMAGGPHDLGGAIHSRAGKAIDKVGGVVDIIPLNCSMKAGAESLARQVCKPKLRAH